MIVVTGRMGLIAIGMLGASIWVGSLVCLAVVSVAAKETLDGQSRVALFRRIGRLYGLIGSASLLTAIGAGIVLAWPPADIDGTLAWVFGLAALLVASAAAGMAQARLMTRNRQALLTTPDDRATAELVRRGAALAGALRAWLVLLTLVIVALVAHLLDG